MRLSELLLTERQKRGISMDSAAEELGVTKLTYRMWERGAQVPGMIHAEKIAAFLGKGRRSVLLLLAEESLQREYESAQHRSSRRATNGRLNHTLAEQAIRLNETPLRVDQRTVAANG